MTAAGDGLVASVESNRDYHADVSHVGHSMLEDFRRSAALYHGRYIAGTIARMAASDEMKLGTALHAYLFETDGFDDLIRVMPACDGRTKEGKAIRAAFFEELGNRDWITEEQLDAMLKMAEAVQGNTAARALLDAGAEYETSIRWTDAATGVACKCKPDALVVANPAIVVDLKTTRNPTMGAWRRQAATLGYHRQAAWYVDGCATRFGKPHEHIAIVVGNCEPHECFVYRFDAPAMELARQQNRRDLERLAKCRETDNWRSELADCITPISLPNWSFYEDENNGDGC